MLYTRTAIIFAELLDLALANAVGGLVDGHLDALVEISHDNTAEGRELGVDHLIVDGPEAMEVQHLLVPLSDWLHLTVTLVADAVIDVEELWDGDKAIESLSLWVVVVPWHKDTGVAIALDKGVDGVAISLY